MPDEKLRYLGTHDYTYALPPYAYDDRGNIVDKDGNILDVKYNRETGREYYVIQGTNQTSEPVLEGMGYQDYQKLIDKMGEEGGMIRYMRILSGMMEGVPGAIDEYFGALEDYNKFAKGAGRRYLAAMAPIYNMYGALGEGYMQQSQEFQQDYRNNMDKYEQVWEQSRNQQAGINNEYFKQLNMTRNQQNAINQQYAGLLDMQKQNVNAIQQGPTQNLNIGGLNIAAQDFRSNAARQSGMQDMSGTLANAGQFNVGMNQALGGMLGDASQFNLGMNQMRAGIPESMGRLGANAASSIYQGLGGYGTALGAQAGLRGGYLDVLNQAAALEAELAQQRFNIEGVLPLQYYQAQELGQLGTASTVGEGPSGIEKFGAVMGGVGDLLGGFSGAYGVLNPPAPV